MQLDAHTILNVTRALFRDPSWADFFCFRLIFALRHLPKLTDIQLALIWFPFDRRTLLWTLKKHSEAGWNFYQRKNISYLDLLVITGALILDWAVRVKKTDPRCNVSHYLTIVGGCLASAADCELRRAGEGRNVFLSPDQLPSNHLHLVNIISAKRDLI